MGKRLTVGNGEVTCDGSDSEMGEVAEEGTRDADEEEVDGMEGEVGNGEVTFDGCGPWVVEAEEAIVVGEGEKRSSICIQRGRMLMFSMPWGEARGGGREGVEEGEEEETGNGSMIDGWLDEGDGGRGEEDGGVDAVGGEKSGNVDQGIMWPVAKKGSC
uniref:Uncharacterized protein LOC105060417 n=1 Tax=Elaeis guineensis var. tenera TaxID=51953 RepID=A0A6I9SG46_ELAGV|nr:uncharacterized protein LOC105060417 [Elaeis guineensis]